MNAVLSRRQLLVGIGVAVATPGSVAAMPANGGKRWRFTGGRWFDGTGFRPRTVYAVDGVFRTRKPATIDETVDLAGGYVVPPFADAHTHHFDNPANIEQQVTMYLRDGVFYAKVLTDVRTRAAKVRDHVNRPDSIDVSYAHGGLTASFGHPIETYEGLALFRNPNPSREQVQPVRASHLVDNDAYYIIDTAADLAAKWPMILAGAPDFIKIYLIHGEQFASRRDRPGTIGDRGLDPALVPLIVQRAHAARLRVSAHVTTVADYRVALAAGVDEMAHLPGWLIPASADPRDYELSDDDARMTGERGVWVVPAPAYYPDLDRSSPSFDAAAAARTEPVRIRNLRRLKRHHVRVAFGSDSFGRSNVKDVLYLAGLGVFDAREILRIWCQETPRTIFPGRRIGRLANGYEASFLALGGDPLADLGRVRDIRFRLKQGVGIGV